MQETAAVLRRAVEEQHLDAAARERDEQPIEDADIRRGAPEHPQILPDVLEHGLSPAFALSKRWAAPKAPARSAFRARRGAKFGAVVENPDKNGLTSN